MDAKMSERKRKILRALAEENIKTNEPVSSSVLAERYFTDLSSATIRNELAAMEEQGIISKTHTSSGRVPTTLGFQLFTDELLPFVRPTAKELSYLKEHINSKVSSMENLVYQAAETLSSVCNLPSVVLSGISPFAVVSGIKIFKLSSNDYLVVLLSSEGHIKDVVNSEQDISEEDCLSASTFLTKTFAGQMIKDIKLEGAKQEFAKFKAMVQMLIKVIENQQNGQMATSGHSKLLENPMDQKSAKAFLNLMEDKEQIKEVAFKNNTKEVSVSVQNLNGAECAIVSCSTHDKNGKPISVAVMGPARMDYEKVIRAVKGLSKIIDEE